MSLFSLDAASTEFHSFVESIFGNDPKFLETEFQNFKSFLRIDFFTFIEEKTNLQPHFLINKTPSSPTCFKVVPDYFLEENKCRLPAKIFDLKFLTETLIAQTVKIFKRKSFF